MERNCHLIDLHKVIMAVILTAIKIKKIYTLYLTNPSDGKLNLLSPHDNSIAAIITFHFCYEYNDGTDVYLISVTNDKISGYNNHLAQWDGSGQIYNYGNIGNYQRLFNIYNQVTGERMRYRFTFNCDLYGQADCFSTFIGLN